MFTKTPLQKLIGKRVLLLPDHPWAGYAGQVIETKMIMNGEIAIVEMDSGRKCGLSCAEHYRVLRVRVIDWLDVVRKYFPAATIGEADFLLWEKTCFPYGRAEEVERQLKELAERKRADGAGAHRP